MPPARTPWAVRCFDDFAAQIRGALICCGRLPSPEGRITAHRLVGLVVEEARALGFLPSDRFCGVDVDETPGPALRARVYVLRTRTPGAPRAVPLLRWAHDVWTGPRTPPLRFVHSADTVPGE